jgi:hypothetical protein
MVLSSQKVTHTPLRGSFKGICGFYLNAQGRISGAVMARRDTRRTRRDAVKVLVRRSILQKNKDRRRNKCGYI